MKALLLAIVGLNLAFYLATNLDGVAQTTVAKKDPNIPELSIVDQDGSINRSYKGPKEGASRTPPPPKAQPTRAPSNPKPVVVKKPAPKKPAPAPVVAKRTPPPAPAKPKKLAFASGGQAVCISLGPFVDKDDAHELNEKLIALNVDSELKSVRERERFWVYLQASKVGESPRKVVAVLKKKGFRFNVIQKPNRKYIIDFGWYKTSRSATNRMKQLRALGYTPKFEVKGSKGEQIWVKYSVPRGKKLPIRAKKIIHQTRKDVFLQEKSCQSNRG